MSPLPITHALDERYRSIHIIRDRVHKTCTWTLGVLILIAGWIVQSKISFDWNERAFVCVGVIAVIVAVRLGYLRDLKKGFDVQFRATKRIEQALHMFDPAFYGSQEDIYPQEWLCSGTENGSGRYFKSNFRLLYLGSALFVLALFLFA